MAEAKTSIAYNGKKMSQGTMDVFELAPILEAMGKICVEAHKTINHGSNKKVSVHVDSNFKAECFLIDLLVNLPTEQLPALLSEVGPENIELILKNIGFKQARVSLLKFIKWLKNREIKNTTPRDNIVEIEAQDEEKKDIPRQVWSLYENVKIREYLLILLSLLEQDEVDNFEVRESNGPDSKVITSITKDELIYFSVAPKEEEIEESRKDIVLQVDMPHITMTEKKWQFSTIGDDGGRKIIASIKDGDYLQKVKNREVAFKKWCLY